MAHNLYIRGMAEINSTNLQYTGANGKNALYDIQIPDNYNGELIVFIHGFMGFKDWGCWNLVQDYFVDKGFAFIKYNVSHNGTTIDDALNFSDMEAFGNNTYSYEVADLEGILDIIQHSFEEQPKINLVGHSRGGGIALLFSHNDRISRIVSWAGISNIQSRFPKNEALENWKKTGVRTVHNSRTGQDLPLYYVQFEDYLANRKRLNIEYYCRTSSKPTLVIHGTEDESVNISEGEQIAEWTLNELVRIEGTQHTFGSEHPCGSDSLPAPLREVCDKTLNFLQQPIDQEHNQNISAIVEMIKLAKSDNDFQQDEFNFIHTLAQMMGISTDEFKELFERYISFNPPEIEFDRILQFQRLILLMNIDGEADIKELNHIRDIGIRMGLNPLAIEKILDTMEDYPNGVIPPDQLLGIFQVYHN